MILDIMLIIYFCLSVYLLIQYLDLKTKYDDLNNKPSNQIINLSLDLNNLNINFDNDTLEYCKSVAGAIYENDDILNYDKDKNLAYNYLVMQEVFNIMLKNQYKEKV